MLIQVQVQVEIQAPQTSTRPRAQVIHDLEFELLLILLPALRCNSLLLKNGP